MCEQDERHWLFRHPLGLPLFEVYYGGLILIGLLVTLLLPAVRWLRGLLQ